MKTRPQDDNVDGHPSAPVTTLVSSLVSSHVISLVPSHLTSMDDVGVPVDEEGHQAGALLDAVVDVSDGDLEDDEGNEVVRVSYSIEAIEI
jgi:hypothetical protein